MVSCIVYGSKEKQTKRDRSRIKARELYDLRSLERMEKKELIERQVSKEDRRFIEVVLTEKGKALQNPILATVEEVNKDVLSEMSQEEQSELKKALRILGGLEDE